jgi:hypothetical protein
MPAKKYHSALKHGGYSVTGILPGESPAEFEKQHQELIAELSPNGALENDIVATVPRLVWRKKNHGTFRIAENARARYQEIMQKVPADKMDYEFAVLGKVIEKVDPAVRAEDQARKELGDAYAFVENSKLGSVDEQMEGLEVEVRLDAMIDKCLKRLLFLRGLKSISSVSTSAPRKRLTGPSKAP